MMKIEQQLENRQVEVDGQWNRREQEEDNE